jgi:RNA polymerase-binding transcription factor DksA
MNNEVMDECDIASAVEEAERNFAIQKILGNRSPKGNIELRLDPNKECDSCGDIIPLARQRIVLSIHKNCDLCVDCQSDRDWQERIYL